MLDLNFVRENLPLVEEKLRLRGMDPAEVLKDFQAVDAQRRQAITEAETAKARRNRASEEIAKLKKSGQDATAQMSETKELREQIQQLEKVATELEAACRKFWPAFPTCPTKACLWERAQKITLKSGAGARRRNSISRPNRTGNSGEQLGILDFERATKLTGARFAVYWDLGAKLERALANFMLDLHTREHGYTEVLPPYLVNSDSMYGTGQLPKFAADSFRVPHGEKDLWLIPTAEVPVTNLYRDETLDAARLPVSLTAYTPCFRSEAGSYGKDVRGIIRQHQFQKVELVKFARPDIPTSSWRSLRTTPKTFCKNWACTTGSWRSARATWASHRPRPMTSKSGCRGSNYFARFLPARISKRSRRAAPTSATVRKARTRPSLSTP